MSLPVTPPYVFGNVTSSIPLTNLDADFATIYAAVNGIGNGTVALANVTITGGTISNVSETATSYVATKVISTSSNVGAYSYGTLSYSDVNLFESFTASANTYVQNVLQNTNSGTAASADYVVSNNLGTATTYYGDYGMNGSGWTGTAGTNSFNAPNMVYLSATSADLAIGTTGSNAIHFVVNSAADAMTINTSGQLIVGGVASAGGLVSANVTGTGTTFISNLATYAAITTVAGREVPMIYGYDGTSSNLISMLAGKMGFAVNASIKAVIDTSGNMGIGTGSPSRLLTVNGTGTFGGVAGTSACVVLGNNGTINYIQSVDSTGLSAYPLSFYQGGSQAMTLSNAGTLQFNQSGQGVQFSNSSALTNSTLNDYETGTWTPALNFGGNSTGITYGQQGGTYTKIGNVVTIRGYLYITSKGTATGAATIAGLPFSPSTVGGQAFSSCSLYTSLILVIGSGNIPELNVDGTRIDVNYVSQLTGTDFNYTNTSFNSSGNIFFAATYQTTF